MGGEPRGEYSYMEYPPGIQRYEIPERGPGFSKPIGLRRLIGNSHTCNTQPAHRLRLSARFAYDWKGISESFSSHRVSAIGLLELTGARYLLGGSYLPEKRTGRQVYRPN